jgi:hypothetical protein
MYAGRGLNTWSDCRCGKAVLLLFGWDPQHAFVGPPSHPESKGPGEVAALHVARDFAVSGMQDSEKEKRPRVGGRFVIVPKRTLFLL